MEIIVVSSLPCNNCCTTFHFVVQVSAMTCATCTVFQQPLLHGSPSTTVERRTCFGMFTFPVCLNCFTNFHITDFAGAVDVITLGRCKRFCFEVTLHQEHTLLYIEHHVVYCLHCALRIAHMSFSKMALAL